jgi:DNA-binding beta-propeller fold protein YncE
VSSDGKVLWLSGRYNGEVNAIATGTGRLLARIPVGVDPPRAMRVATARALLARAYRRLAVAIAAILVADD